MRNPLKRALNVLPTPEALAQALCEQFQLLAREAVAERGRFTVALSGGRTPQAMYRLLGSRFRELIPWNQVHLFWGDERYVSYDDPQSNYRMVKEALLDAAPIPPANIHPMPTDFADPARAASAYEEALRQFFGEGVPEFDLVLLGMGPDGHTASLFPGTPAAAERQRLVVVGTAPTEPRVRLSLTFPVLLNARQVYVVVSGAEKREVLRAIATDPDGASRKYPVASLRGANVTWFVDEAAVGG